MTMTQKEQIQELTELVFGLQDDFERLEWICERVLKQYGSVAWDRYSSEWEELEK